MHDADFQRAEAVSLAVLFLSCLLLWSGTARRPSSAATVWDFSASRTVIIHYSVSGILLQQHDAEKDKG